MGERPVLEAKSASWQGPVAVREERGKKKREHGTEGQGSPIKVKYVGGATSAPEHVPYICWATS